MPNALISRKTIEVLVSDFLVQRNITLTYDEEVLLMKRTLKQAFTEDSTVSEIYDFLIKDELVTPTTLSTHVVANRYIKKMIYSIERFALATQPFKLSYAHSPAEAQFSYRQITSIEDENSSILVTVSEEKNAQTIYHSFRFHNMQDETFGKLFLEACVEADFPQEKSAFLALMSELEKAHYNPNAVVLIRDGGVIEYVTANHNTNFVLLDTQQHEEEHRPIAIDKDVFYLQDVESLPFEPEYVRDILIQTKS